MTSSFYLRVQAIRSLMAAKGWDAVVLRGSDPHCSECLAPRFTQVTWTSGFTGEAGDLVITRDHAGLWTDSRYFIQAVRQLEGSSIQLHKTRLPESVDIPHWLAQQCPARVACDSLCESVDSASAIREQCRAVNPDFELVPVPDLADLFWSGRPQLESGPVITLNEESVGMTRGEKISWLRGWLRDRGADYFLLSTLDDIAWLLNVRGCDIDYNPVVFSYLLLGQDSVQWFVAKGDSSDGDEDTLDSYAEVQQAGVSVEKYDSLTAELERVVSMGSVVAYDPATLNFHMAGIISAKAGSALAAENPVPLEKAVKTAAEIDGIREACLEDGLAVEKFLFWLETTLAERDVSEWEAACKVTELRSEIPGFRGESFETISAWGPGAALPHYITPKDGSTFIQRDGLYLCDSGGQYFFGTTDITRTVPTGATTYAQKEDYTLVLQGMIDLSTAVFPYGTAGCQIDALAREPLWRARRNFGHGTGHGIGFFLCCHETPPSIRQNFYSCPLQSGMVCSNEPGLYREGEWGIRHENMLLCREMGESQFGRFLGFETLTCCHIDTSAVLPQLLSRRQKEWLNNYNEQVYRNFESAIEDEVMLCWLRKKTQPVE